MTPRALTLYLVSLTPPQNHLSKDKKEKVKAFKHTTNAGEHTAKSYLEMFSWDLMLAVDEYYANGGSDAHIGSSGQPAAPAVSIDDVNQWFDQYADPEEEDTITEEGILKFCEDISVDPQDVLVLVIAWKMEAAYMCAFTRKEWIKGMQALGCDSIDKLKAKVPQLSALIESERNFKKFYSFCFGFSKEPGQKSLGLDIAIAMWELLLSTRFPTLTPQWLQFLREKTPCKGITRDTWDLLLDFFTKVQESYDKYDENEAWPVLIDDYMSWIESTGLKNSADGRLALAMSTAAAPVPPADAGAATDFKHANDLPQHAFFQKEYVTHYRLQVNELVKRMEHLLEQVDNFEVESAATKHLDDVQLAFSSRETMWQNLTALLGCEVLLQDIVSLFKEKIRESMEVEEETTRQLAGRSSSSLSREAPNFDNSVDSGESGSSEEEFDTDEEELPPGFQNVEPVQGRKEIKQLNDEVTERIKQAFDGDEQEFNAFKAHAFDFGTGKEEADDFYGYLRNHLTPDTLNTVILDFARLLVLDNRRIPLLKAHYAQIHHDSMKNERHLEGRNKSWSDVRARPRDASLPSSDANDSYDSEDDRVDEFPATLRLTTVNHLVFIIHGIGQHIDFQEGEFKSWNGQSGLEGGNHSFRDLFRVALETTFRDIPVALEMQSVEWHEDLHEPTGVDTVFDLICPEGSAGIREFNKETLMDVLYYLSPRYGQLIIDSVTQQLNQKYDIFMEEHPGWDGKVSIFAHSLGSVISYDILTHSAGEVSANGVKFPGLEFEVENFFAAGSPVPVMILSRGDLKLNEGQFEAGIKMPNCKRYFNIFHPIDPIAYRIEPLIKQEMHDKAPVQLIGANSARGLGFIKLQEILERLTAPGHGFSFPRIDYVMKRRKREGMMEFAFASASHSSYWMSEDVVMFTLMQICRPVVAKLHRYMSARRPLPTLMRNVVELTPHSKIYIVDKASIRETCTGLSHDRVVLMNKDRLFILPNVMDVACRCKWCLPLTPSSKALYGDDSFTLKIVANDVPAAPRSANSSRPLLRGSISSSTTAESYVLKAPTTPIRDEWMSAINTAILRIGGGHPNAPPPSNRNHREKHLLVPLPQDMSSDVFGAIKTGFLQERTPKGWYEGWSNRWFVLQDDCLASFENSPRLEFTSQFKLRKTKIFCYERVYLFRIISRSGTALEMRARDQQAYHVWLEAFAQVPTVTIIQHRDLVENSPSAIMLASSSNDSINVDNLVQTKIEGYQLALDDKGGQYAVFVIQVLSTNHGSAVIHRRFSEFAKLHRQLRKMFPHEQIPPLPQTRMWNKFDPSYLKEKSVHMHGYLNEVTKRCTNTRAQPILFEFLDLSDKPAEQ
ncbi:TPA: hypothetical protein N0F65_000541 [Lagenidium giganteum]|uniref:Uncharacterized protein n=1 Tax=Lagenidium giganteum TaxID=4803 RepID=A0AAV2YZA7_9STRA|nr:TPA: hypothetical protein N0F65_000541 [Lagenidium giganteum]